MIALCDEIAELLALVRELQRFKDQGEPRYEGNFLSKEPPAPEQQQLPQPRMIGEKFGVDEMDIDVKSGKAAEEEKADDMDAEPGIPAVMGIIARLESAQLLGPADFLEIWEAISSSLLYATDADFVWAKTSEDVVREFVRDCLTPIDPAYEHHLVCDVLADVIEDFKLFVTKI